MKHSGQGEKAHCRREKKIADVN